jgi:hypothetical protein
LHAKALPQTGIAKNQCPTFKENPRLHGPGEAPQPIPFRRSTEPRHTNKLSKTRDAAGGLFDPLQLKVALLNLWIGALALP